MSAATEDNIELTPDTALVASLAAAQGEFPTIEKTQTANVQGKDGKAGYSYKYADLGDVLAKIRPVLSSHGLALVQRTKIAEGGKVVLVTELRHVAGGVIASEVELGQSTANAQAFGGALTYLRRYEAVTLLGIAAEEDRDAQDVPVGRAAPTALPGWATSLNRDRNAEVLDQLEVLIGREPARELLVEVKQTAGDGVPSLVLPLVRGIVGRYLDTSPDQLVEQREKALLVAAGDTPAAGLDDDPPPPDPPQADADVSADTDGLEPAPEQLKEAFGGGDGPLFEDGDD